jgi:hypothetical protein
MKSVLPENEGPNECARRYRILDPSGTAKDQKPKRWGAIQLSYKLIEWCEILPFGGAKNSAPKYR